MSAAAVTQKLSAHQIDDASLEGFMAELQSSSVSCRIGCDLLNLSGGENLKDLQEKVIRACRENSEHLTEIFLVANTIAGFISETKEDLLRFMAKGFLVSDACLSQ